MTIYRVSAFSRLADPTAHHATLTLAELIEALTTYDRREAKDGHLWSPATFDPPSRALANVRELCALVYDLDDVAAPPLPNVHWPLAIVHETHTPGRYRVTLPLSRPVSVVEWQSLHSHWARKLDLPADPKALDASRAFFLPSHPPKLGRALFTIVHRYDPIDPDDPEHASSIEKSTPLASDTPPSPQVEKTGSFDLSRARARLETSSKLIRQAVEGLLDGTMRLASGERNDRLHRALSALSQLDPHLPEEGVRQLLTRVLEHSETEPEGLDYWLGIGMSIWSRRSEEGRKRQAAAEVVRLAITGQPVPENTTPLPPPSEIGTFWQSQFIVKLNKDGEEQGLEPIGHNVALILQHDEDFRGCIRWNEMSNTLEVTGGPLKGVGDGSVDTALVNWLVTSKYKLRVPRAEALAQILLVADRQRYNPAREYVSGLKWDGVKRIDSFFNSFAQLMNYNNNPALSNLMLRKFLISAIARLMRPGCQVDTSLLLYGSQGIGKSQFVRALGGKFAVNTHLDAGSKDAVLACHSGWIVELTEMAGLRRSDVETTRSYLSSQEDTLRLPYGRGVTRLKRHSVFICTTNDPTPLSDPDGNRRFLPVAVDFIDVQAVEGARDQLWAEAKAAYEAGEAWWLQGDEAKRVAAEVSLYEREPESETIQEEVVRWLSKLPSLPNAISTGDIARRALFVDPSHPSFSKTQTLIARAMRSLGSEQVRLGSYRSRGWKVTEKLRMRVNSAKETAQ